MTAMRRAWILLIVLVTACSSDGAGSAPATVSTPPTTVAEVTTVAATTTVPAVATSAAASSTLPAPTTVAAPTTTASRAGCDADAGGVPPGLDVPEPTVADVAYADTSPTQVLDLYLPDPVASPVPLVIDIHGGGFRTGDKRDAVGNVPVLLAAGYAVASIDYRTSCEALFPAGAQDVKAAVRWLRAHAADYGIDPTAFASWGTSAGGYMAVLLGTTGDQATVFDDPALGNAEVSSAVQAVVAWFAPTDFLAMDQQFAELTPAACNGAPQQHDPPGSPESVWLGAAMQTVPELATAASPITYIATATTLPPFSLAAGSDDCVVPNQQSAELDAALRAAGGTSTFELLEGAVHGDPQFGKTQTRPALELLRSVFGR